MNTNNNDDNNINSSVIDDFEENDTSLADYMDMRRKEYINFQEKTEKTESTKRKQKSTLHLPHMLWSFPHLHHNMQPPPLFYKNKKDKFYNK